MRWWSWIACLHFILHLHLQSPFSLSSSSLFLLLYREKKVRNGRMGWVGNCFSWWSHLPFHAYDMWGQGLSGGQLNPHSLHAVQVLTDGLVLCRTVQYSLLVEWWIQALGMWHWGQLLLSQRSIIGPLTILANAVHLSVTRFDHCGCFTLLDCESPCGVGKQCIHGFYCVHMLPGLI